jgi:dihydrolipoamide dehydrogenase
MENADAFGLACDKLRFEIDKVIGRSRKVSDQLANGVGYLFKKHKIELIKGEARLESGKGAPAVVVTDEKGGSKTLAAKHVILATGARARTIPDAGLAPDGDRIWTYREAMIPTAFPNRLLVVGSGAIGMEFASFYRLLGAEVTVVEMLDRILPVEDEEISGLALKAFKKQGIAFHTGAQVSEVKAQADGVSAVIKGADGKTHKVEVDNVVLAMGIVGNVEDLGLEELGVEIDRSHVKIDGLCRTGAPGLYAIGDVAGPPWLAHKAMHEGVLCVEAIAGVEGVHPMDANRIPGCTYCLPQIASVGLTERQAKDAGREVRVGRFPFLGNGKAIALGEPEGLVKTVFDAATGELLGAHMIGAEVTELIQGYAIAMTGELTEAELAQTVFPHPTLSEMMHESVLDAYGRVLHV